MAWGSYTAAVAHHTSQRKATASESWEELTHTHLSKPETILARLFPHRREMEEGGDSAPPAGQGSISTAAARPKPSTVAPSTSFKGCRPALNQETVEVVQAMGFESMTPVQVQYVLLLLSKPASSPAILL